MGNLTTFPDAHLPSSSELKARRNIFIQVFRFAVLNVKMIVMVGKGHH